MSTFIALPAFNDNYIWLLRQDSQERVAVVATLAHCLDVDDARWLWDRSAELTGVGFDSLL